jgi:hypothetical protein
MSEKSLAYQDTLTFMQGCYDRRALLDALLDFADETLDAAWIGLLSGDQLLIQRGVGRWEPLGERLVALNKASYGALCASEPSWHAAPPKALRALMPLPTPRVELVLVPIAVAGRVVVALGGVPRAAQLWLDDLGELIALATCVSQQLEQIIMLGKAGKLPPVEARIPARRKAEKPKVVPKPPPIPSHLRRAAARQAPSVAAAPQPQPQPQAIEPAPARENILTTPTLRDMAAQEVGKTLLGGFDVYRPTLAAALEEPLMLTGRTIQSGLVYTPTPAPAAPAQPTILAVPGAQIMRGARGKRRASAALSSPLHHAHMLSLSENPATADSSPR